MATPSIELSAPYVLFPLPLPLHQTRSKDKEGVSYRACFTASVEPRKRKRDGPLEIAAAIDGEGLNIYDTRSTKTVSSHALPPTTKFSCPPTSVVTRASNSRVNRRTYAAVSFPKKQIICWEEASSTGIQTSDSEVPAKQWSRNSDSRHDIMFLQDLSQSIRKEKRGDQVTEAGLLAIYADGHIKLFTEDLENEKWDFLIPFTKKSRNESNVAYASITTITKAKKAILKNRPDIGLPALVEDSDESNDSILLAVTQTDDYFRVRLITIPLNASRKPRELVDLPLPVPKSSKADPKSSATFALHIISGTLCQLYNNQLSTYNLSTTVPTVTSTIDLQPITPAGSHPLSIIRVSSSSVLITTNDDISLYDTKFSSLQSRVTLRQSSSSRPPTPMSSAAVANTTGSVTLTSFVQDLDLAVGYSQTGIVGIQLTRARGKDGQPLRAKKGGLLIDSLCRGVKGLRLPREGLLKVQTKTKEGPKLSEARSRERQRALESITELQKARRDKDVGQFERTFATHVGALVSSEASKPNGKTDIVMTNGIDEDWSKRNHLEDPQALVKTNGADAPSDIGDAILETYYKPLRTDFVTSILSMIFDIASGDDGERLEISFYPPNVVKYLVESRNFPIISLPRQNGLVKSLVTFDPTLRTLSWFLSALANFPIAEVVSALEIALEEHSVPKGESSLVQEIYRTEILRLALVRLSSFPAPLVVKALRILPGAALLSLAAILRKELNGGVPKAEEIGIELGNMGLVADLLTAVLDAIGVAGIVLSETTDMLTSMEKEVAQSLEGIQEAIALKGLFEEVFRHVDWDNMKQQQEYVSKIGEDRSQREIEKRRTRNQLRKEKRGGTQEPSKEKEPTKPVVKTPTLPKKKPAVTPSRQAQKSRHGRATADARKKMLERINSKRKLAIAKGKQNKLSRTVTKPRDPALPLGVTLFREVLDPLLGRAVPAGERMAARIQHYKEGLTAGVYSVETVVI